MGFSADYGLLAFLYAFLCLGAAQTDGRITRGCGDPGTPSRGYRIGDNFRFDDTVEFFCNPGFQMVKGTRLRTCHANGNWSGSLPTCADINECVKYSDLSDPAANNDVLMAGGVCHVFAQCFNTIGSFMCMCNVGYHGNGRECYPAKTTFMSDEAMKRRPRVSASSCGTIGQVNSSRVRRIVGGKISAKAAWPWQAAIYYKDRGRNFLFNGALIKSRWVLTVANAVLRGGRPIKPRKLKVILGELNRDKEEGNEQTLRVKRIITHPGYSRTNLSHNIALLELAKPAKLNNYIRKVICHLKCRHLTTIILPL